ncbi:MAG TPA: hypothetical protein VHB79_00285 [Polyangiaceae bacterium]|nr:hypothetical protein [Polyangiaceae bacterium]
MQPRTHAFVIRAAVAAARCDWLRTHEAALLQGNEAEDDFVLGPLRLRAPGLTHSYRPGSRFGELWAPSARTQLERWLQRASRASSSSRAAFWLGRACHLLGDMAVPARTRGVWHLLGDPLEAFWEAHEDLAALLPLQLPATRESCLQHAESLARFSSSFAADTTRTPWGAARFRLLNDGQRLDSQELSEQAVQLLTRAVSHTRDFLREQAAQLGSPTETTASL